MKKSSAKYHEQKTNNRRRIVTSVTLIILLSLWVVLAKVAIDHISHLADTNQYTSSFEPYKVPDEVQQSDPSLAYMDSGGAQKVLSVGDRERDSSSTPSNNMGDLRGAESKLKPLTEYATGVTFAPILDEGLYLVGVGVRKKSIIKLYAVAMYCTATVLDAFSSMAVGNAAQSLGSPSAVTTFVLEIVYGVGAEKIASAIAESVQPRYNGTRPDITAFESLIVEGVNSIGGQAVKGTVFRFDCSVDGVDVTVNGKRQGMARF